MFRGYIERWIFYLFTLLYKLSYTSALQRQASFEKAKLNIRPPVRLKTCSLKLNTTTTNTTTTTTSTILMFVLQDTVAVCIWDL